MRWITFNINVLVVYLLIFTLSFFTLIVLAVEDVDKIENKKNQEKEAIFKEIESFVVSNKYLVEIIGVRETTVVVKGVMTNERKAVHYNKFMLPGCGDMWQIKINNNILELEKQVIS